MIHIKEQKFIEWLLITATVIDAFFKKTLRESGTAIKGKDGEVSSISFPFYSGTGYADILEWEPSNA